MYCYDVVGYKKKDSRKRRDIEHIISNDKIDEEQYSRLPKSLKEMYEEIEKYKWNTHSIEKTYTKREEISHYDLGVIDELLQTLTVEQFEQTSKEMQFLYVEEDYYDWLHSRTVPIYRLIRKDPLVNCELIMELKQLTVKQYQKIPEDLKVFFTEEIVDV